MYINSVYYTLLSLSVSQEPIAESKIFRVAFLPLTCE